MTAPLTLVVLAKAPVPGRVKTRLCPPATSGQAADLAAAALLDTLAAAAAVPGAHVVVALTGDVGACATPVRDALRASTVVPQRGADLGHRIAAAFLDASRPGVPTLLIGMDTPQVTAAGLADAGSRLAGADAVFGPAADGGWWALGLHDPAAAGLIAAVPTSRADTGDRTLAALRGGGVRGGGLRVAPLPGLRDVDTIADAVAVAEEAPHTGFAATLAASGLAVPASR